MIETWKDSMITILNGVFTTYLDEAARGMKFFDA